MTARSLVFYPDARLRLSSNPVSVFDEEVSELVQDIVDTLHAVSAIGLTAAHIGRQERIAAIRPTLDSAVTVYVNPRITEASTTRSLHIEGSVSMPGITERVERADRIAFRYADCSGVERNGEADGFLAACLQHEIDQLDGIFWINRLTRVRRERAVRQFARRRPTSP